ncbi:MAG: penicillin-binding protein 2 [Oscillospiraceae bacterium]|nr:penicillin-binding protein 2 [Oscillospiraceae bacterium]
MSKRTAVVYSVCITLLMSMVLRLCWVWQNNGFVQAMSGQSRYTLQVGSRKGGIYDRNMEPLVDREYRTLSAVVPTAESLQALHNLEGQQRRTLLALMENRKPFLYEGELGDYSGITTYHLPLRYTDPLAAHLIGYQNGQGQGVSGIEAAYNDFLEQMRESYSISCSVDAIGQVLQGEVSADQPSERVGGVVLSIDRNFQQAAEQALQDCRIDAGAVVITDIWTGQLLAMASCPTFDPNNVAAALQDENSPLVNRALSAYNVGSVFKLVVAAAALEEGIPTTLTLECPGYIEVDGTVFRCHNLAGHGQIDMTEAVKRSCNVYFIKLAQQLGGEPIRQMAAALGFGSSTQLADGIVGVSGELTAQNLLQGGELANFAFGQGRLTATPLQLAAATAAIANGGQYHIPQLVLGTTAHGTAIDHPTEPYAVGQAMSAQTADILRDMMVQVVEEGSGGKAKPTVGGAGGKTASAQTGRLNEEGSEVVQAWFAGFYPAQAPRWAIVVLCEDGGSGGDVAAPVFGRICNSIAALGYVASDLKIP